VLTADQTQETITDLALECINLMHGLEEWLHATSDLSVIDEAASDDADLLRKAACTRVLWTRDTLTSIHNRIANETP
jgi:hypothetical protein